MWGYLEYRGGYHEYCGVILSAVGDVQYHGDIMMHVGGYHEYHGGCSVPWAKSLLLFEYPMVLNTPTVLMISPTCIMISLTVLKFQRMASPTVLNTPTVLMISPTCIMVSPTVLNIPHGTQDNPTVLMISPQYSRYPPHLS